MGDASAVLLDGRLLLGGVMMVLLAVALAPPIARRLRVSQPLATGLLLSTGVILATTLLNRSSGWFDVARLVRWEPWRWYEYDRPDWLMNVALFVPAAAFWTVAVRRPAIVLAVAVLLSAVIEYAQGMFRLGTGDQADLAANGLGALVGVAAGWVWARRHPPVVERADGEAPGWTHRQFGAALGGTVVAAALSVFAIGVEADRRVDEVTGVLVTSLGPATSDDLASVWAQDDRDALAHFTTAFGFKADAITRLEGNEHVVVRYPIEFFGAQRCIYADVGPTGTELSDDAGDACDSPRPGGVSPTAAPPTRASAPPAR